MSYQLEVIASATREIRALPARIRAQAIPLIDSLIVNPRPSRSKELRGKPNIYRVWLAGRWRIVYRIDDERQLISILRVRLKDDIDYASVEPTQE